MQALNDIPTPEYSRAHIKLPEERLEVARTIAKKWGITVTSLFRFALRLLEIFDREVAHGNRIAIVDKDGNVKQEIPLPF